MIIGNETYAPADDITYYKYMPILLEENNKISFIVFDYTKDEALKSATEKVKFEPIILSEAKNIIHSLPYFEYYPKPNSVDQCILNARSAAKLHSLTTPSNTLSASLDYNVENKNKCVAKLSK